MSSQTSSTGGNGAFSAPAGTIRVSDRAIAAIVARAAHEADDVVGLVAPDAPAQAAPLLAATARRGVVVRQHGGLATVEVFVLLVYGAHLSAVAQALEERITRELAFALGSTPTVRVRLKGVRRIAQEPAAGM
jgi:uncharacterized alkaline shock family protein YloU